MSDDVSENTGGDTMRYETPVPLETRLKWALESSKKLEEKNTVLFDDNKKYEKALLIYIKRIVSLESENERFRMRHNSGAEMRRHDLETIRELRKEIEILKEEKTEFSAENSTLEEEINLLKRDIRNMKEDHWSVKKERKK